MEPDAETTEKSTDAPIQSSHSNAESESDKPEPRRSTRVRRQVSKWWSGDASALAAVVHEHLLTYSRATKGGEAQAWKGAIDSELKLLAKNGTWELVPRQQTQNVLTPKWVFKRKDTIDADGSPSVKYKARLACRGFQQVHGIDYHATDAPVVKFTTLRMVPAIIAHLDLELQQMDAVTAFLNGDRDEDIYMEQPEGFVSGDKPDFVCKLLKALYGLKQAQRRWHTKVDEFLVGDLGFESCPYDPCLYVL